MKGKHKSDWHKRNIHKNIDSEELLSKETLYIWRKKAAIEIQFLTRTKKEFYELYLRNKN